ncbi:MAG: VOC family protein [Nocardioidaceae bacterium]
MYLNLWADDRDEQLAEVERLISLGARRVEWGYPDDADFVVLADPEGSPDGRPQWDAQDCGFAD